MSVQRIVEDSPEIDLQAESLHMTADTETPVSCIWHSHYQFPQFLQMRDGFDDYLYHAFLVLPRVVTKISSCRVNTTSRRGIKWLGISFGSIFLLFSDESSRGLLSYQPGKIPGPQLLMTTLITTNLWLCIKLGQGQGDGDIETRVWGPGTLGTQDEGLGDIKWGTWGHVGWGCCKWNIGTWGTQGH